VGVCVCVCVCVCACVCVCVTTMFRIISTAGGKTAHKLENPHPEHCEMETCFKSWQLYFFCVHLHSGVAQKLCCEIELISELHERAPVLLCVLLLIKWSMNALHLRSLCPSPSLNFRCALQHARKHILSYVNVSRRAKFAH